MDDTELQIKNKRTELKNLLDQLSVKQKELTTINHKIEKVTSELKLLDKILKVDRAVNDLDNYPDDFIKGLKTWGRKRLNILYSDMTDEELDMLYERIRTYSR